MGRIQLTLFQRLVFLAAAGAILFVLISQVNYHGFEELPAAWAVEIVIVAGLLVLAMWPKSPEEGTGFLSGVRELRQKLAERRNKPRTSSDIAEPQNERSGYLARHWRGELSLPISYWVNGVLLGVLVSATIAALTEWLPSSPVSLAMLAWLWLIMVAVLVLVSVWSQVGIWRSAGHHVERGGRAAWAFAAQVLVIIGVLAAMGEASRSLWPQLKDVAPLAFGRDPLGQPAEVSISAEGRRILIKGPLAQGTSRRFLDALADAPRVEWVVLTSPGGRLLEACGPVRFSSADRRLKRG